MTARVEAGSWETAMREADGGCLVSIRVTPRASASEVFGVSEGRLRVRLHAPPVDGAANAALIALLAKRFKLPKSALSVVRGETGREKTVRITGCSRRDLIDALKGHSA